MSSLHRYGLVLLLSSVSPVALAQSDDKIAQNYKLIFDAAENICKVAAQPTGQVSSGNSQTDVRPQLDDLSQRLASSGMEVGSLTSEQNLIVLQRQLTASVDNNVQCQVEVFKSLTALLSRKPASQRVFSVTRESGWRGGYSPDTWCVALVSILRGEYPQAQFQVTAKSERGIDRCRPFKCQQYNYSCTVQVTTSAAN